MKKISLAFLLILLFSCVEDQKKENSKNKNNNTTNLVFKESKGFLKDSVQYNKVEAIDKFSVMIPNDLQKTEDLNSDAILQYKNIYTEAYFILIEEPKKDFVKIFKSINEYDETKSVITNYQQIQIESFTEGMVVSNKSEPLPIMLDQLMAEQVELSGFVDGIGQNIYYLITFIEGKESLYMMMQWTLKEKEAVLSEIYKTTANSFKELVP